MRFSFGKAETPGFFRVVFVRKKRVRPGEPVNEPLNETVNEPVKVALVQAIRNSPGIGRSELMRIAGKSRATVTRALTALVGLKIVEHRGSDKTGGYYLTSEKRVCHG